MSITKDFAELPLTNWLPDDIDKRDRELSDELTNIFNTWVAEYEPKETESTKPVPTPEQEEMLRQLREAGLI